tara:strand:+ start:174 stop:920 length:747 start_codon:yes stop_codon:yes gene_type:complete
MTDFNIILVLLIFLITLQSMAGVGILVLGTPIMLLLNYGMIEILSTLLPLSILTSLTNFIYFKLRKKKLDIEIDAEIKKYLFLACCPSIIVGLLILKYFNEYINFNILVSIVIFSSIFLVLKLKNKIFNSKQNFKIFSLATVGLIHGITNSGGTLLSLFVSALKRNKVNQSRFNTTFAYLFLALFQYLSFIFIFNVNYDFDDIKMFIYTLPLGIILGNMLIKFVNEYIYKSLINILAFISAIFLLFKI